MRSRHQSISYAGECRLICWTGNQASIPLLRAFWLSFRDPLPPSPLVFVILAALLSAQWWYSGAAGTGLQEVIVKHSGTLLARHLDISHGGSIPKKLANATNKAFLRKYYFYSQLTSTWLPQLHIVVIQIDQSTPRIPLATVTTSEMGTWPNQSQSGPI